MDNVLCPHCGQAVLCNPQLVGQALACPSCQGQFTMPAAVAKPAASIPAKPAGIPVMPPLPPPVIRTSQPDSPPAFVTAPPKPPVTTKRPALDQKTLLIAGIAATALLLVGAGLVVVINWPPDESGEVAAGGQRTGSQGNEPLDSSEPLPPLDQLIGRKFPADHPDAEARIAEARQRSISIMQGGGEVQIGDISVSDNPARDYGGFQFGMITEKDGTIFLVTGGGKEPLQIPRSFASHKSIVQNFLERHHGAAAIRFEQLTDEPYYLARLKPDQEPRPGSTPETEHGRSREEIQRTLDLVAAETEIRYSIGKLERIGTVVRAVYRIGPTQSEEEFLVLNGKVVFRFPSSRSVSVGGD